MVDSKLQGNQSSNLCWCGSSVTVLADFVAFFLHKTVMVALAQMSQECFSHVFHIWDFSKMHQPQPLIMHLQFYTNVILLLTLLCI